MFKKYAFILLSASLYLVSPSAFAANVAGTIERLQGSANVVGSSGQKALVTSAEVFQGDQINTAADAELLLRMTDGTVIAMRPNSNLIVSEYHFDKNDSSNDNIFVRLLKGGLRTVTGAIGKKIRKKCDLAHLPPPLAFAALILRLRSSMKTKKRLKLALTTRYFKARPI
jgi:hypothetical protein